MVSQLSQRLTTLAQFVPKNAHFVDVGTDHAYIPIYLAQSGITNHVIATDVAHGPLETARVNISEHGLKEVISLRQGDGLQSITPGEVDTILIAGMGGHTATEILKNAPDVLNLTETLIIQPMNASHLVRRFLDTNQFGLVTEVVLEEDERLYEVIVAKRSIHRTNGDSAYQEYRQNPDSLEFAYEFGPLLLKNPTPAFIQMVKKMLHKWGALVKSISQSGSEKASLRQEELIHKMNIAATWLDLANERHGDR